MGRVWTWGECGNGASVDADRVWTLGWASAQKIQLKQKHIYEIDSVMVRQDLCSMTVKKTLIVDT